MAYLDSGAVLDNQGDLFVDIRGKHEAVDIVALPFYKRAAS